MGMAASQARLLTITARMHDVEYQAQSIQNAKIVLATQQDEVYQKYLDALDEKTLTIKNDNGERIPANFNTLCGINAVQASKLSRYILRDDRNAIIVDDEIADGYERFKTAQGYDAYDFAFYMMDGEPQDFYNADGEPQELSSSYNDSFKNLFTQKLSQNKLTSELSAAADVLTEKLIALKNLAPEMSQVLGDENIKEDPMATFMSLKIEFNGAKTSKEDNDYVNEHNENQKEAQKLIEDIDSLIGKIEQQFYMAYSEEVYEDVNKNTNDFDNDDFWYYVNMFKQIEANGGSYKRISEYDGLDGIGDASTDGDWLKSMIESGKITIDKSDINKKTGVISFSSTGVSSDTYLENTTTSTIDKAKLAKAEAEYEHDTKMLDQKDKKFDMDLSKLETERNALKTEYESVKKVISDNIDRTFGIFS